MTIDDKLEKVLDRFADDAIVSPGDLAVDAAINAIPLVGGSISSLFSGKARQRIIERCVEVFKIVKERIEKVEETKVAKEYFETEEFQTLLSLVIGQLQTSHQHDKLRMLGTALANSGLTEFTEEHRKELFLRALQDLTPAHVDLLRQLLPDTSMTRQPGGEDLAFRHRPRLKQGQTYPETVMLLQQLSALGLVEEQLEEKKIDALNPRHASTWTNSDIERQITKFLQTPPERSFQLSSLGRDFLKFLGVARTQQRTAQVL